MIEQSKRRGRPVTGQALTPAEKQKAYRQRLANKPSYHDSDLFVARRAYDDSLSTIESYKNLVLELQATLHSGTTLCANKKIQTISLKAAAGNHQVLRSPIVSKRPRSAIGVSI